MSEIFIQPSAQQFGTGAAPEQVSGTWFRGIPTPGVTALGIPAVAGVATCRNLLAMSPPTLLEEYEIYSYTIGWSIYLHNATNFPAAPNVEAELALLVNDRVAYLSSVGQEALLQGTNDADANSAFVSDLNNPIRIGARDRLALRFAARADQPVDFAYLMLGVQSVPAGGGTPTVPVPFESTLSYRVIDLPGARRL